MSFGFQKPALFEEFKAFLLKHGVIGLAVAVVVGGAVGKLVKAIVDDLVMPIVGALTPAGDWRSFTAGIGKLQFGIGDLFGNFLDFGIVALIVFFVIKSLLKEPAKPTGPNMKQCPQCLEPILAQARRCRYCTSEVSC